MAMEYAAFMQTIIDGQRDLCHEVICFHAENLSIDNSFCCNLIDATLGDNKRNTRRFNGLSWGE